MDQLYFDGMVICSHVGFQDLFVTLHVILAGQKLKGR